jgi:hypothetical protein
MEGGNEMTKKIIFFGLLILLFGFMLGCGSSGGGGTTSPPADTTAPTISSRSPAASATGVATSAAVSVTFSEAMDSSSITTASFTLSSASGLISGSVTYTNSTKTATFTPASSLDYATTYSATVSASVADSSSNTLASASTWTFTTTTEPVVADTTAPTISSVSPTSGATGVSITSDISAVFSEAMDSSTITSANFTLYAGSSPITGAVTYTASSKTAAFSMASNLLSLGALSYATTYTATISASVSDEAGNPMGTAYTWSFTTASTPTDPGATAPSSSRTSSWSFNDSASSTFFSECMRVSDNGQYLVGEGYESGETSDTVYFFDYTSNTPLWSYTPEDTRGVTSLALSGDGSTVVLGSDKVYVFSYASGTPLFSLDPSNIASSTTDTYGYNACAVSEDGQYIAAGSGSNSIVVIDKAAQQVVASFYYERESDQQVVSDVASLAISDDGRYVAVGGSYIYLYDRQQDEILWSYALPGSMYSDNDATYISITPDGSRIAANNRDYIYVFSPSSGTPIWSDQFVTLTAYTQFATSKMSEDGEYITVAYESGNNASKIKIYKGDDGTVASSCTFVGDGGKASICEDGTYSAVRIENWDQYVYVFDRRYGSSNRPFHFYSHNETGLYDDDDLELSADGSTLFYEGDSMRYRGVLPGILVDAQDTLPVYTSGQTVSLRTFVTNPFETRDLEIQVRAYLPQFAFWEGLEDEDINSGDRSDAERGGIIAENISDAIGGGRDIFTKSIQLGAKESYDVVQSISMPALENPSWLDTLLGGSSIFDMLGDIFSVALDAVAIAWPDDTDITADIEDQQADNEPTVGFYPMVGVAQAKIVDADTDEVFGTDSFMFVYLAQY